MPKVTCLSFAGLDARFHSSDHRPPHFHVEKADEWEIKVHFLNAPSDMVELVWGKGPTSSEAQKIVKAAEAKRTELTQEWSTKVVDPTKYRS